MAIISKAKRDYLSSLFLESESRPFSVKDEDIELMEEHKNTEFVKYIVKGITKNLSDINSVFIPNSVKYACKVKNNELIDIVKNLLLTDVAKDYPNIRTVSLAMSLDDDEFTKVFISKIKSQSVNVLTIESLPERLVDYAMDYYSDARRFKAFELFNFLGRLDLNDKQVSKILKSTNTKKLDVFLDKNSNFRKIRSSYFVKVARKFSELGYTNWQGCSPLNFLAILYVNFYSMKVSYKDEDLLMQAINLRRTFSSYDYENLVYYYNILDRLGNREELVRRIGIDIDIL